MENKKEPLMSAEEFFKTNNSDLSSDIEYNIEQYANYVTQWHLNNAKEFVWNDFDIDKQSIHTAIDNYIEINLL